MTDVGELATGSWCEVQGPSEGQDNEKDISGTPHTGKYFEIEFDYAGRPCGGLIKTLALTFQPKPLL